jgi:hypothetical protein
VQVYGHEQSTASIEKKRGRTCKTSRRNVCRLARQRTAGLGDLQGREEQEHEGYVEADSHRLSGDTRRGDRGRRMCRRAGAIAGPVEEFFRRASESCDCPGAAGSNRNPECADERFIRGADHRGPVVSSEERKRRRTRLRAAVLDHVSRAASVA